jgi:hypothetical protein
VGETCSTPCECCGFPCQGAPQGVCPLGPA